MEIAVLVVIGVVAALWIGSKLLDAAGWAMNRSEVSKATKKTQERLMFSVPGVDPAEVIRQVHASMQASESIRTESWGTGLRFTRPGFGLSFDDGSTESIGAFTSELVVNQAGHGAAGWYVVTDFDRNLPPVESMDDLQREVVKVLQRFNDVSIQ